MTPVFVSLYPFEVVLFRIVFVGVGFWFALRFGNWYFILHPPATDKASDRSLDVMHVLLYAASCYRIYSTAVRVTSMDTVPDCSFSSIIPK